METIVIDADINNMDCVTELIEEQLEQVQCPEDTIMDIETAAEEIFANVAHYAYKTGKGTVTMTIEVLAQEKNVIVTFTDNGVPFNPLAKPDPDTAETLHNDQIGGLGIYIVKKTMDKVEYKYENKKNILVLEKKFE